MKFDALASLEIGGVDVLQLVHTEYGYEVHTKEETERWDVYSTRPTIEAARLDFIFAATTSIKGV